MKAEVVQKEKELSRLLDSVSTKLGKKIERLKGNGNGTSGMGK